MNNEAAITSTMLFTTMVLYPDAALGAFCGALFFLMMPNSFSRVTTAVFAVLSGLLGYSVGYAVPDAYRMAAAFCGGALGITLFVGASKAAQKDWHDTLVKILEIIRGFK